MSVGSYRDWLEGQMPSMGELTDTKRRGSLRIYRYPQTAFACGDTLVVTTEEYDRVRQCLTDPKEKPSEAALEAAEFLRSLPIPPSTR